MQVLQLYVVAVKVRGVSKSHHGISVTAHPFDVHAELSCIFDDLVEDIIGRHGDDAGPDLLEGQLDGVVFRDSGASDDGDYGLDPAVCELKGQDHAIDLEEDAGLVDLRTADGRRNG